MACRAREEGGVVDGAGDVELGGELDRLAALEGLGVREVVRLLGEDGGEAVHRLGAFAGGGSGPAGEGGAGGGDGRVHVVGARQLVAEHALAGRGVHHLVVVAGRTGEQLAADVLRTFREAVLNLEAVAHDALLRRCTRWAGSA